MATENLTAACAPSSSPANDPLNGYTPKQALALFETIATHANGLSFFLATMLDKAPGQSPELASGIQMACRSAELIGLLADRPTGGTVNGSVEEWCCGSSFGLVPQNQAANNVQP